MNDYREKAMSNKNLILPEFLGHEFSDDPARGIIDLSSFLSRHGETRGYEHTLIEQVSRAFSESVENLSRVMSPKEWNIDRLVETRCVWPNKSEKSLRKPRIFVDYDLTSKGNLRVRWFPDEREGNDFRYDLYYYTEAKTFHRSPGELIFIRDFANLMDAVRAAESNERYDIDRWFACVRIILLKICIDYMKDFVDQLSDHFEITLLNRVACEFPKRHITRVEIISRNEADRRQEVIDAARKLVLDAKIAEEREAKELAKRETAARSLEWLGSIKHAHGIEANRLASLHTLFMDAKGTIAESMSVLTNEFGLTHIPDKRMFLTLIRKINSTMRTHGAAFEPAEITSIQARAKLRATRK